MRKFTNVNCEHLATFQSEKIGIQHYYFCTMEMDERTIRYTIMFDAEDILTSLEQDTYDDDEQEEYACDLAYCNAEVLASLPSMEEVLQVADKWIDEYNNGARFSIATNEDIDNIINEDIPEQFDIEEIRVALCKCDDRREPLYSVDPTLYNRLEEVVEYYCDSHDLASIDMDEIIPSIL